MIGMMEQYRVGKFLSELKKEDYELLKKIKTENNKQNETDKILMYFLGTITGLLLAVALIMLCL